MVIILANWQVWNKNYNPSFYKLVVEFNTRREAERFVRDNEADFWDEENGFCGLEVVKARKTLFGTEV